MEIKSINPKLERDEIAKKLRCRSSTLERYRHDINMLHLIESHQIVTKDDQRPQVISKDLK